MKKPTMKVKKQDILKIISDNGESYGRYCGIIPEDAASKAFTKICQKLEEKNIEPSGEIKVILQETTRGDLNAKNLNLWFKKFI